MAQAPIQPPTLYKTTRPNYPQITAKSDGTNTFVAGQFLKLVSGNLATCVIGETTSVFGLSLDGSHASTDEPYTMPFGENHNVCGLQEATFLLNTAVNTTRAVGTGTSSGLTVGSTYGINYFTDTGYTNVAFLDSGNTTAAFFRLVDFYPNDATTDTNARVIASVVNTASSV